jgi:uncharacterized protein
MNFVIIGKDGDDGSRRKAARADHLDYIATRQDKIVYAGPLLEEGKMVGSIFVYDVQDRAELDRCLAGDPYFAQAIFADLQIYESRWMVPEREPGLLAAEAERARG